MITNSNYEIKISGICCIIIIIIIIITIIIVIKNRRKNTVTFQSHRVAIIKF